MTISTAVSEVTLRPYSQTDERAALDLLVASLGDGPAGRRPPEYFRWKHYENPFGRSFMLVAEAAGEIVGLRALMRWQLATDGVPVRAVRAVDTATHPQWQGKGLFTRLTLEAIDRLRDEADLIFNTPNEKSLPGYLKMGWRVAGKVPISVKVRRPVRFARHVRELRRPGLPGGRRPSIDAPPASEVLALAGVGALLAGAERVGRPLATPRSQLYLNWRYAAAPLLDYRAVVSERSGAVVGVGIFRVRPRGALWETTVCEVITAPGDRAACRDLLRAIAASVRVDHMTSHFPSGSVAARALRGRGFLPSPTGMTFVVNPLRDALPLDPEKLGSWALSLGDLEVF